MECFGDNDSEGYNDGNQCEIKNNRKCTDRAFLIILILSLIALFSCLGYCIYYGDLDRIINGYDDCGNVCGKNNINTDNLNLECYGKNMKQKKYLEYYVVKSNYFVDYIVKECVESCADLNSQKDIFGNRCFKSKQMQDQESLELLDIIKLNWKVIVLMSFFAILFSFIIMLMYRYHTGSTIRVILYSFLLLCISATICLWVNHKTHLVSSIIATILTVILVFIVIAIAKNLKLIIAIFKESAKAIADMPLLLLQPLATFIAILLIILCGTYTMMWVISSGYLKKLSTYESNQLNEKPGRLEYEISNVGIFTKYYNYFIILWMIQFVIGCQHIIVGGSVATWFFTRNKINLDSPIKNSTFNLVRYHLGTVCLGSLIITIFGIIKAFVRSLKTALKNENSIIACVLYFVLKYILDILEIFFKFFSRNAYIQTAIHGYSFCKGGKRAFNLLVKNMFQVIVINSVGDYILCITKFYVAVITTLISFLILLAQGNTQHMISTLMIIGCISFIIAHSFVSIYEMAIDAIFLCFCEDCEVNDGITRPFFMSRNLMEIVASGNKKYLSSNDIHFSDTSPKREIQQGS